MYINSKNTNIRMEISDHKILKPVHAFEDVYAVDKQIYTNIEKLVCSGKTTEEIIKETNCDRNIVVAIQKEIRDDPELNGLAKIIINKNP